MATQLMMQWKWTTERKSELDQKVLLPNPNKVSKIDKVKEGKIRMN